MSARRSKSNITEHDNLLDLTPVRLVDHEMSGDGTAVLLRPRFIWGPLARWLQPRLLSPHVKVRLDELGTFVWLRCDGQKRVDEILEEMSGHFGDKKTGRPMDQAVERLQLFLHHLCQGKMLRLEKK